MILTKALKDVMTYQVLGFTAIAPQSEAILLNKETMDELTSRFKRVIVNFDNDPLGELSMRRYNETYGLEYFSVPEIKKVKDVSDYCKFYKEEVKQFIKEQIESKE